MAILGSGDGVTGGTLDADASLSGALGTRAVNPLLATVGFSYVFLRLLELLPGMEHRVYQV